MRYAPLGRTDLNVSVIGLGCMTFGREADEGESRRLVEAALEAGVTLFDAADVYSQGTAEEILGGVLRGRRQQVIVATKVGKLAGAGPAERGLTRAHIVNAVEGSLRRLGTDYIDLYQAHRFDTDTPLDETLAVLDELVSQGKVRYIGCSNYGAWQLCKALWESDKRAYRRFESVQARYNLLARGIEWELLPLCASEQIGVVAYNVLASGFLSGRYRPGTPPSPGTRFAESPVDLWRYWGEEQFVAAQRHLDACADLGVTPAVAAVAWVLAQPVVTTAVVGARRAEQLRETLEAADLESPSGMIAQLSAISDRPGSAF